VTTIFAGAFAFGVGFDVGVTNRLRLSAHPTYQLASIIHGVRHCLLQHVRQAK
jgi:hypothetical protein